MKKLDGFFSAVDHSHSRAMIFGMAMIAILGIYVLSSKALAVTCADYPTKECVAPAVGPWVINNFPSESAYKQFWTSTRLNTFSPTCSFSANDISGNVSIPGAKSPCSTGGKIPGVAGVGTQKCKVWRMSITYFSPACTASRIEKFDIQANRAVKCPLNYIAVADGCVNLSDKKDEKNLGGGDSGCSDKQTSPQVGNPLNMGIANKFQPESDYTHGRLQTKRYYNSAAAIAGTSGSFGVGWTGTWHSPRISLSTSFGSKDPNVTWPDFTGLPDDQLSEYSDDAFPLPISRQTAYSYRADGRVIGFRRLADGSFVADDDIKDRLTAHLDGGGHITGWEYYVAGTGDHEIYGEDGKLLRIEKRSGTQIILTYTGDNLSTVTDDFGATLQFSYGANGKVSQMTDPSGQNTYYSYDADNNLVSVTYPGNAIRTYVYHESGMYGTYKAGLLTGIVDELGNRFATFKYSGSTNKAVSTEHFGGVNKYTVSYIGTNASVTDPLGVVRSYVFGIYQGMVKVLSINQPCTTGCGGSSASMTYDTNGNVASRKDFNGNSTSYAYDLNRNLETSRTEAYGTALARTITTIWHPDFDLPTQISEPGRATTYTYDTRGNRLTETVSSGSDSRTWTWTYSSLGQVLTANGPRTDVNDLTTYEYDPTNGNLAKVTDPAGQITIYGNYNAHGQPGLLSYPNGRVTSLVYDLRGRLLEQHETISNPLLPAAESGSSNQWSQWLVDLINYWCNLLGLNSPFTGSTTLSQSSLAYPVLSPASGDAVTFYSYDSLGQLKTINLPDGELLTYEYDGAHRLIGLSDGLGNQISYTLNNAGLRAAIDIKDGSGVLQQKITQIYTNLGRLQQVAGNNGQSTTYGYDNNGNVTSQTNAQGHQTTFAYDNLNRLIRETNPASAVAKYSYNPLDQLLSVTDPRNLDTSYTPNAFGEVEYESSPDTGTTSRGYTNGLLTSTLDARGIAATYQYDILGRITQRQTGSLTSTFSYDAGTYGQGRLTRFEDASGATDYTYNSQGRVVEKLVGFKDGLPLRVRYAYTLGGKLKQTATPGRHLVEYNYGTNGLLTGVSVDGVSLLNSAAYGPEGIKGWTWVSGGSRTETRDLDARLTGLISGSALQRTYGYNNVNRLTSLNDSIAAVSDTYGYDAVGRLTSEQRSSGNLSYAYDYNGNRSSKTQGTSTAYTIASTSNRLTKIGSTGPAITYLATGQTSYDGTNTYGYSDEGRLTSVIQSSTVQTNTYNALGQRVKKVGSSTLYFMYDEEDHLLGEYQSDGTVVREYVWLGDRLVGMISAQKPGVVLQVHTDHLGSPRAVTDGTTVLWRWEGDAFGNTAANEDVDADSNILTQPLRFPGQYKDPESGLNYNYFRDYNPATGRYVQSDPIGLQGGLNTYGYVGGSPLMYYDPEGKFAIFAPLAVLAGEISIPSAALWTGAGFLGIGAMMSGVGSDSSQTKDEALAKSCPPRPGNEDPCKGLREMLAAHEKKLSDYLRDPLGNDNKKFFETAPPDKHQRIKDGRISNLQRQIDNFRKLLEACERMHGGGGK